MKKHDIERIVNNERDGCTMEFRNEDVLFNVFDVLDLIENALVDFDVLNVLVLL